MVVKSQKYEQFWEWWRHRGAANINLYSQGDKASEIMRLFQAGGLW